MKGLTFQQGSLVRNDTDDIKVARKVDECHTQ